MDLNQSRNEFRNRFRMSAPQPDDGPESPLEFLARASMRRWCACSPPLRPAWARWKRSATISASSRRRTPRRSRRPVRPSRNFSAGWTRRSWKSVSTAPPRSGVFGSQNKANYWDLYAEMFAGLCAAPRRRISACVHRSLRQGVRSEAARLRCPRAATRLRADRGEPDPARKPAGESVSRASQDRTRPCGSWSLKMMTSSPTPSRADCRPPIIPCTASRAPRPRRRRSPDEEFALAVIDVGLPGADGLTLVRRLRSAGKTMPTLILTARCTLADKVKALDIGADDFLSKPFEPAELAARCRALMRRAERGARAASSSSIA